MLQYLYDMKCDIHLTTATLRRTAFHFAVLRHKMACFHWHVLSARRRRRRLFSASEQVPDEQR